MRWPSRLLAWTVIAILAAAGNAAAQMAATMPSSAPVVEPTNIDGRPMGVLERPHSDYAARGINLGAFTFYPQLTGGARFDDNIYARPTNRVSDWIYVLRPEFLLKSNWPRHAFWLNGWVEALEHQHYGSDNQLNGGGALGGTLEIQRDLTFTGQAAYQRNHEERGTGDSLTFFDKPVAYNQFDTSGSLNKRFNRLYTIFGGSVRRIDYETPTVNGVPVSQDYRDGTITSETARVGYDLSPMTSVFVEGAVMQRRFGDPRYNSDGYRMVGGLAFEPSRLTKGEIYVGYLHEGYNTVGFRDISVFTYGGNLAWYVTPLLTITFDGRREAKESSYLNGVSILDSQAGVKADYELLRNLIVGGGVGYIQDKYEGTTRADAYWQPSAYIKYLINPIFTAGFDYKRTNFKTDGIGVLDYTRDVYMLYLNAKL